VQQEAPGGGRQLERHQIAGCVFSAAIVTAPFIAMLYSLTIALVVLAFALATTIWFGYEALQSATGPARTRLRGLLALDAMLLVAVIGALARQVL
jgi:VIT1/CCC1 family predicted Fe2+/Mn2+ transporter